MAHDHKGDMRAAFLGLIIGVIVLFALVYTIVQLTNSRYASHAEQAH